METSGKQTVRFDYQIITEFIESNSRILDLGCGDGALLHYLINKKKCKGIGIEIDEHSIYQCIEKGLTVSHSDINEELSHYADQKFDYIILNESLQQVLDAEKTIEEALRVGKHVIVGVPNFCFWKARLQIFFLGRVPKTKCLPYEWYNTPNVRFFSLKDFRIFCRKKRIKIEKSAAIGLTKRVSILPNMFANAGIFLLSK